MGFRRKEDINPENLQYRWHHLISGATGLSRFENSLPIGELDYRKEEGLELTFPEMLEKIAYWNKQQPNHWWYEPLV